MSLVTRRQFLSTGVALAMPWVRTAHSTNLTELELILALDASGSVFDTSETIPHWVVQLNGHIYALNHEEVRSRLISGRVFLRIVTCSDRESPVRELFGETIVSSRECDTAIEVIKAHLGQMCHDPYCENTTHYWLIEQMCKVSPMGYQRVLDISTDQVPIPTSYMELKNARDLFHKQGGTVNALAVKMDEDGKSTLRSTLCSPHGFCVSADQDAEYANAITQKILTETA